MIVDAVRRGDVERAAELVRAQIFEAADRVKDVLHVVHDKSGQDNG
jgi:DNA-binding GntR family transcriptional regulator